MRAHIEIGIVGIVRMSVVVAAAAANVLVVGRCTSVTRSIGLSLKAIQLCR